MKNGFKNFALIVAVFTSLSLARFVRAQSANYVLSTSASTCSVGASVVVSVRLKSLDIAANAVSGAVSFPVDTLAVVGLEKNNSLIQFWVQEPQYNNVSGTISFEGVIFNPGYQGNSGNVLDIRFRCRQTGLASIVMPSGFIMANDGQATNILTNLADTTVAINIQPIADTTKETGVVAGTKNPPRLSIESLVKQNTIPIVAFLFKLQGADEPDYYEVIIDDGTKEIWPTSKGSRYETKALSPGSHTISVRAIYANNYALFDSRKFIIEALKTPVIKDLPLEINADSVLAFEVDTAYPFANVKIDFQPLNGDGISSTTLATDKEGILKVNLLRAVSEGSYLVRATVLLDNQASSLPSVPAVLRVTPSATKQLQNTITAYLKIITLLAAIIIVLSASVFYVSDKIRRTRLNYVKQLDKSFTGLSQQSSKIIEHMDGVNGFNQTEAKSWSQLKGLIDRVKKTLNSKL